MTALSSTVSAGKELEFYMKKLLKKKSTKA